MTTSVNITKWKKLCQACGAAEPQGRKEVQSQTAPLRKFPLTTNKASRLIWRLYVSAEMNLNQITIPGKNVPKSIDYYKNLGLRLIVHTHDDYARFECPVGDATFSLHRVSNKSSGPTGIWIYFEVENVDETMKQLQEKMNGLVVVDQPEDKPWLWREARIQDLDGNQIIIYTAGENRKNPPWRLK